MPAPILTKLWNITPNQRRSYTSLLDTMGWFLYTNKTAMLASGWSVKYSCSYDGVSSFTGPINGADTTDRWTSITAATGRGTGASTDQSYVVLENTDGVQVLFAYQGGSDDIARISFSPGGLFTLNTPSTYQPTATDEVLFSTGNSLITTDAASDRVMTVWCSTDSKHWSAILFRAGSTACFIGVERIVSYCGTGVFNVPYVGYRYTAMALQNSPSTAGGYSPGGIINATAPSATGFLGCAARVFTAAASRIVRCGAGDINAQGVSDANFGRGLNIVDRFFGTQPPHLQGNSSPCYPFFWMGEKTANLDGCLGSPIDWLFCKTTSGSIPGVGDFLPGYTVGDTPGVSPLRTNWYVSLGSECIRPWMNAAASLQRF